MVSRQVCPIKFAFDDHLLLDSIGFQIQWRVQKLRALLVHESVRRLPLGVLLLLFYDFNGRVLFWLVNMAEFVHLLYLVLCRRKLLIS